MMTDATTHTPTASQDHSGGRYGPASRRLGYLIAILVNGAMLWVCHNILAWDIAPWLTESYEELLPLINLSLGGSILANFIYFWFDVDWFKSLTQALLALVALFLAVRTWQVFPFDFSSYDFDWAALTRMILIFVMIGITIGLIAETAKFLRAVVRPIP